MQTVPPTPPVALRIYDFAPPVPWACSRCGTITITQDAAPRCPVCGFRDVQS